MSSVFDGVLELLFEGFRTSRGKRTRPHPALAGLGTLLLGGLVGGLTTWALPNRLFGAPLLPGASLVLSPLVNGALMHAIGAWRVRNAQEQPFMATFWGGALFAFGFATMRLLLVTNP